MKRSLTVHLSEERLSAIEMYLEQKNTTLTTELDKYVEQLYSKIVPQNVRDFIEKSAEQRKPHRKRSTKAEDMEEQ